MTTGTPATDTITKVESIDQIQEALGKRAYIADRSLGTALFLALRLGKPLLLEGEAGVGKTEVAKTMADLLDTQLIRLQCYEGLDVNHAVYEWNYAKQMLEIRMLEAEGAARDHALREIFGPEFLIKRPLLQAVEYTNDHPGKRPVLLIDEIDRADEEFEAFLLELLSDFQITVPEIGTIKAAQPPVVIITSNRTRELHDALKRRCLYHWIDYPSIEKEEAIIAARQPHAPQGLARQVSHFMHELRRVDLYKVPGVAETLDWAAALVALDQTDLRQEAVDATLGAILKHQEDVSKVTGGLSKQLIQTATTGAKNGERTGNRARSARARPGAWCPVARPRGGLRALSAPRRPARDPRADDGLRRSDPVDRADARRLQAGITRSLRHPQG